MPLKTPLYWTINREWLTYWRILAVTSEKPTQLFARTTSDVATHVLRAQCWGRFASPEVAAAVLARVRARITLRDDAVRPLQRDIARLERECEEGVLAICEGRAAALGGAA